MLADNGTGTGKFEMPTADRRFQALSLLVKQKRLAKTACIPCFMNPDHARQVHIWDVINSSWYKELFQIRRMLTEASGRMSDQHAVFESVDAYEAAGDPAPMTDDKGAAHANLLAEYRALEEEYAGQAIVLRGGRSRAGRGVRHARPLRRAAVYRGYVLPAKHHFGTPAGERRYSAGSNQQERAGWSCPSMIKPPFSFARNATASSPPTTAKQGLRPMASGRATWAKSLPDIKA